MTSDIRIHTILLTDRVRHKGRTEFTVRFFETRPRCIVQSEELQQLLESHNIQRNSPLTVAGQLYQKEPGNHILLVDDIEYTEPKRKSGSTELDSMMDIDVPGDPRPRKRAHIEIDDGVDLVQVESKQHQGTFQNFQKFEGTADLFFQVLTGQYVPLKNDGQDTGSMPVFNLYNSFRDLQQRNAAFLEEARKLHEQLQERYDKIDASKRLRLPRYPIIPKSVYYFTQHDK
ncbi:hypothetical protein BCR43DRAFT_563383 [Syncephalastrum racemosum]|uniref:Uncharacterized protein n=1 Tax=Syncephalastrum racemosum TaxID=13706 RepID=A0A1X2HGI7_SYNRA|nr:hypothetical protein BCR43DRAFT_563383 [Syncephalastrum racemosum]